MIFKICLIGCGAHSSGVHGPSLKKYAAMNPQAILAACCDMDAVKAAEYSQKFGFMKNYTGFEKMLDDECPSVVSVVTPVKATFDVVSKVMKRGYPVILEKPPGIDAREARELLAISRQYNIPNRVAFNRRFMPIVRKLKQLMYENLRPGSIQNIEYYVGRFNRKDSDFSTTAIHGIDTVRFIMDCNYSHVKFFYQEFPELGQGVANIHMYCTFENGAAANIHFCPVSGAMIERVRIDALDNTFFLEMPMHNSYDSSGRLTHIQRNCVITDLTGKEISDGEEAYEAGGFYYENASFFDMLISGQNPQEIATAVQSVEVAECIRKRLPEYKA
ncbi:MAG: Gfo/Idh/MocA family oxidoreductase [Clostridiaceae bacterium]